VYPCSGKSYVCSYDGYVANVACGETNGFPQQAAIASSLMMRIPVAMKQNDLRPDCTMQFQIIVIKHVSSRRRV